MITKYVLWQCKINSGCIYLLINLGKMYLKTNVIIDCTWIYMTCLKSLNKKMKNVIF